VTIKEWECFDADPWLYVAIFTGLKAGASTGKAGPRSTRCARSAFRRSAWTPRKRLNFDSSHRSSLPSLLAQDDNLRGCGRMKRRCSGPQAVAGPRIH